MPSKSRKLSPAEITAFEATRDVGAEILRSIKDMKAGKGKVVLSAAAQARQATGLSQSQFADLLGVSVRPLQGWEQGRKQPSGAARALLAIARTNPKAVLAVSALSSASECLLPSTRFARSPGLSRLAVGKTPGNPDNQAW